MLAFLSGCDKPSEASKNRSLAPAALVPVTKQRGPQAKLTTPQAPSGSRLRSVYFQGDDGSRAHFGFFDKERKEQCSFDYVSGGKGEPFVYRCFPDFAGSRACDEKASYYQDSNCSVPMYNVWSRSSTNPPEKYYLVTESTSNKSCEGQSMAPGVYLIKKWVKPTSLYQKNAFDQSCSEFTLGFENYKFFEFGERVPDDAFARAVLTTDLP